MRIGATPVWVAAAYEAAVRALVLAWKERGDAAAARVLAATLRRLVVAAPQHDLLIFVPANRAAWSRRGFTPIRMLASRAHLRGITLAAGARTQQKYRSRQQRSTATHELAVRSRDLAMVRGKRCLIVDDVITTGSTVRGAIRAVAEAGGVPVGAVAIARVPRTAGMNP